MTGVAVRPRLGLSFWTFIAFMLVLTGLFVGLGVWQVQRLAWKEKLIETVSERLDKPPYELPPTAEWAVTDLDPFAFHPVTATGRYLADKSVLVFTSLSDAKGKFDGPGYWVMTPFAVDGGGTVFVNRGFVPQQDVAAFAGGSANAPAGTLTVTGVAIAPEEAGAFTPGADHVKRVEWVRDPVRLAALAGVEGSVLPLTIDAPAAAPGALPQGGETVVDFPNNHLGYAFTWFGFAILTPCLLVAWIWRQLRPRPA